MRVLRLALLFGCSLPLAAQLPDAPIAAILQSTAHGCPMIATASPSLTWGHPLCRPFATQSQSDSTQNQTPAAADDSPTMFRHPDTARYLLAGQANIILQAHGPFHSPYQDTNSLLPRGEYKTSLLGTIYAGYELNPNPRYATDAIVDYEAADGRGDSEALGLGGFTNLDVVRNPNLGKVPYFARYELHQVIGLTDELTDAGRSAPYVSLQPKLPIRRLEFYIGRMGMPDLFDINSIGSDSHLQFMNWTDDNNGAWDYAANTRGYTDAAVVEYVDHNFTARYGIALMPYLANGEVLQYQLRNANGQNVEFELRRGAGAFFKPLAKRKAAIRLLGFVNHANMGDYRQQNQAFLAGLTSTPDISAHSFTSSMKYGVGLNFEQELTELLRVYGRFGWNEGQHESYAYTEVDQTFNVGGDYSLKGFGRPYDKVGVSLISNAIKRDHQAYLALGGLGFILGDGKLDYAREDIVEAYDNVHAWKGVYYALDLQFVDHPGYNQARGPALVESVRMHVDF